jgi:uncharacterized membrane protein
LPQIAAQEGASLSRKGKSKMAEQSPSVYNIVVYEFEGRGRAKQVVELLKKGQKGREYKVPAWAIIDVDERGKAHIHQSGHGGKGAAIGAGVGVVLGLIGGPAGLLAWTLGSALIGGVAGKVSGREFDSNQLKALAVSMEPNTSAIMVVIDNKAAESAAKAMQEFDAKVVTLTIGSQISGELEHYESVDLGEGAVAEEAAETENKVEDAPKVEPSATA